MQTTKELATQIQIKIDFIACCVNEWCSISNGQKIQIHTAEVGSFFSAKLRGGNLCLNALQAISLKQYNDYPKKICQAKNEMQYTRRNINRLDHWISHRDMSSNLLRMFLTLPLLSAPLALVSIYTDLYNTIVTCVPFKLIIANSIFLTYIILHDLIAYHIFVTELYQFFSTMFHATVFLNEIWSWIFQSKCESQLTDLQKM